MQDRDARLKLTANVVTRRVGEETVLLDLASGTYFGLDPVGSRFLELLETHETVAAVIPVMLGEFDVTEEELASDLAKLSSEMLAGGLLARA